MDTEPPTDHQIARELQLKLLDELKGERCRCGTSKARRKSVCLACYRRLPKLMRDALYQPMGRGYAEAYAAAIAFLKKAGRIYDNGNPRWRDGMLLDAEGNRSIFDDVDQ